MDDLSTLFRQAMCCGKGWQRKTGKISRNGGQISQGIL
jgi:hypothetical protein